LKPEIEISRVFDIEVSVLCKAITKKEWMKLWYFDFKEFKPEVGFTFEFTSGHEDGIQYNHTCEVTEVIFEKKLTLAGNTKVMKVCLM